MRERERKKKKGEKGDGRQGVKRKGHWGDKRERRHLGKEVRRKKDEGRREGGKAMEYRCRRQEKTTREDKSRHD